jgi:hypothetical protein
MSVTLVGGGEDQGIGDEDGETEGGRSSAGCAARRSELPERAGEVRGYSGADKNHARATCARVFHLSRIKARFHRSEAMLCELDIA